MKWPKLKHPLLCNVVLVGGVILLFLFAIALPSLNNTESIPQYVTGILMLAIMGGLLWFLISQAGVLMILSALLEMYRGYLHARRYFTCPKNGTKPDGIRKRILRRAERFGYPYEVKAAPKELIALRYQNLPSATVYYHRIEKLLLVYETDTLDWEGLGRLWRSANSITDIIGREQAPRHRKPKGHSKDHSVSVAVVILANTVSPDAAAKLVEENSKMNDRHVLLCAVELSTAKYYFDNQKEPFVFSYPVKNRAINRIQRIVFGGRVPLRGNPHTLPEPEWLAKNAYDPEASLWSYMGYIKKEAWGQSRRDKKRFQEMANGTVIQDGGWLYCKIEDRVDMMMLDDDENDPQKKQVILSLNWMYPKSNRISKKDRAAIRRMVEAFLGEQGYGVTFVEPETDD